MPPLIRFDEVSFAFGEQKILVNASFAIEAAERVCLIGRNGSGKSSTLRLITGELEPDGGEIHTPAALRIGKLDQALAHASLHTAREVVLDGMAEQKTRIEEFQRLSQSHARLDGAGLRRIEALERAIEAGGGWSIDTQVDSMISQLQLPAARRMSELSGGWRRRVALAKAMVSRPDLLLLDEPTNHLDITTIEWLEREVARFPGAVLFVTHDRSLVERLATRIIEIDRGQMRNWPGGYRDYLHEKRKANQQEDRQNALFDKKLAEEEAWIRRGIKAREHRNEGRVRALEAMREERAGRMARPRPARIHVNESGQVSGKKVVEVRNVSHSFDGEPLLSKLSLKVVRGDRIGIIGNNGVGKSTLLRILLGELTPEAGSVKLGTHLEVAYFDQLRRELEENRTVAEIVGEGREYITMNGRKKHVVGYLTDFLFTAKRAMTPVSALSGGERNRVLLAKLFTRGANLLVLDEPTNDLDVETLEALERKLSEYSGTLIVVSHDRHFLDNVVTSVLVFEADGLVRRYAGGYSHWARHHRALAVSDGPQPAARKAPRQAAKAPSPRKLSYKLQRELEALPGQIEALEQALAALHAEVNEPQFYQQAHERVRARLDEWSRTQERLDAAVERWAELEDRAVRAAQNDSAGDAASP